MNVPAPVTKKSDATWLIVMSVLAAVFFNIDVMTQRGVAEGVLYIVVIWLSQYVSQHRYLIISAAASSLLIILGAVLSPEGGEVWKVIANRILALTVVWVTALLLLQRKKIEQSRERVIGELQDALARVKTLSGLLPICASCKKIRDDNGYWNQVEVYIRDHSDAEFSHGLCPDCAQKARDELKRHGKK